MYGPGMCMLLVWVPVVVPPPPTSAPQNSARLDNCEINKYTVGGWGGGVAPHRGGIVGK